MHCIIWHGHMLCVQGVEASGIKVICLGIKLSRGRVVMVLSQQKENK